MRNTTLNISLIKNVSGRWDKNHCKSRKITKTKKTAVTAVCPKSLDPIYIVNHYMKRGKTSWTDGTYNLRFWSEKGKEEI